MSESVIYLDRSEVREGKLDELKAAIAELARFVESREPRVVAYNAYFSEDGRQMTVIHVHPDSASLEFHMEVAGPAFPRFAPFIKLLSIDIYGIPSDAVMLKLREKARLLGGAPVRLHPLHRGFARLVAKSPNEGET